MSREGDRRLPGPEPASSEIVHVESKGTVTGEKVHRVLTIVKAARELVVPQSYLAVVEVRPAFRVEASANSALGRPWSRDPRFVRLEVEIAARVCSSQIGQEHDLIPAADPAVAVQIVELSG